MRPLILFSLLFLLVTKGYSQSNNFDNTSILSSLESLRNKTANSFVASIDIKHENSYITLGDLTLPNLQNHKFTRASNIKLIVNSLQRMIDNEAIGAPNGIYLNGAQTSQCDGQHKVEIIEGNSIRLNSFIAAYLKRYFQTQ